MQWRTDTYRLGALERIDEARLLKKAGRLAFSMYTGGLAVEGMLRSLCCLRSTEFDERHDLRRLAHRVAQLGLLRGERDDDFVGVVGDVARRWQNTLRFSDQAHLERTPAADRRVAVRTAFGKAGL
jgi:HEPN domain-containing protein